MKFKKLIMTGLACLSVISGTVSLAFSDIKGHWAEPNIRSLEEAEIINGYGDNTFKPDINMSRGEASKIMIGVLNINPDGSESDFADLGKGHWAYSYVSYLSNKGIINGYGDKTFRPNSSISRAELAKISYGILKEKSILNNSKKYFKDSSNHWASDEISSLAGNSIIDGDGDNNFRPNDDITRAEASKIIYSTIKKIDPYRLIDYFILTNRS
ncbi:MAG: S-layer homology domain-containing protein [Andreesenia angusta]|nr:S-layer homology domain-containing protein [Andreesenia angusta]